MKIRSEFVTNSSSSSFVLLSNGLNSEQKAQLREAVLNPLPYKEEFVQWLMSTRPRWTKDNPDRIPFIISTRTSLSANQIHLMAEKYGVSEERIKEAMTSKNKKDYFWMENPEYNQLPDKIEDENEWVFMEEFNGWELLELKDENISFSTDMDNFDFMAFCEFLFHKLFSKSFKFVKNTDSSRASFGFCEEYIKDLVAR